MKCTIVFMFMFAYVHVHINTYIRTNILTCVLTFIHIYRYKRARACVCACASREDIELFILTYYATCAKGNPSSPRTVRWRPSAASEFHCRGEKKQALISQIMTLSYSTVFTCIKVIFGYFVMYPFVKISLFLRAFFSRSGIR